MYIFVKFDCKDLKQYDFPFMDNKIIWIWIEFVSPETY